MKVRLVRYVWGASALAATAMLIGCGGGFSPGVTSPVPAGPGGTGSPATGSAHLVITIPRKQQTKSGVQPHYVSPGTQSMKVAVSGSTTATFNLTSTSPNCSTLQGGAIKCQESMTIASGKQTLTVTLYDRTKGRGDALSTATISANIPVKGFKKISIALDGVPATAKALIAGGAEANVTVGVPTSLPVTVEAYDASGNLIIPPGDYTAPITVEDNDQTGVTSFSSSSPTSHRRHIRPKSADTVTIKSPTGSATLYYNGGALTTAITVTPSVNGKPQPDGIATLSGVGFSMTGYSIPTANAFPRGITTGPDGALWFTECRAGKIGRITTSGTFTEYVVSGGSSTPDGIVAGPDGALWFADSYYDSIGRITTDGSISEYTIPGGGSGHYSPGQITVGSDNALWFTDTCTFNIGRITTSGTFSKYNIDWPASYIAKGPDGAIWASGNNGTAGFVSQITTSGTATTYPLDTQAGGIVAGPDGALWVGEQNTIDRMTTDGTITNQYTLSSSQTTSPAAVTIGSDNALYFTDNASHNIWRITTDGAVTSYTPNSSLGYPASITKGADGALWFTALPGSQAGSGNDVVRFIP